MRSAPPVVWPVGLPRRFFGAAFLIWFFSLLAACAAVGAEHGRVVAVLAVHAVSAGMLWVWWRGHTAGLLWWNGQSWAWTATSRRFVAAEAAPEALPSAWTAEAGDLVLCLDCQCAVLVQWRSSTQDRASWWWVPSQGNPVAWAAFRRALYCPPHLPTPSAADGHSPSP